MSGNMSGRPGACDTMARSKTKLCPLADKALGRRHSLFDIRGECFPAPGLIAQRNVTTALLPV